MLLLYALARQFLYILTADQWLPVQLLYTYRTSICFFTAVEAGEYKNLNAAIAQNAEEYFLGTIVAVVNPSPDPKKES
jgi:hypothetical protein